MWPTRTRPEAGKSFNSLYAKKMVKYTQLPGRGTPQRTTQKEYSRKFHGHPEGPSGGLTKERSRKFHGHLESTQHKYIYKVKHAPDGRASTPAHATKSRVGMTKTSWGHLNMLLELSRARAAEGRVSAQEQVGYHADAPHITRSREV